MFISLVLTNGKQAKKNSKQIQQQDTTLKKLAKVKQKVLI